MKRLALIAALLAVGCGKKTAAPHAQAAASEGAPAGNAKLVQRGQAVPAGAALSVSDVLAKPDALAGKEVIVEGEVRRACSRKGCWMELAAKPGDEKGEGVRVTFKDYGFFVPTDSAGAKARVAGAVTVAELEPEMADHLEGEGAAVARDANGKPREVQLVATGVELRRP